MYRTFRIIFLILVMCYSAACSAKKPHLTQDDPNFENGEYVNNHIAHPNKSFFSFLKMRWFGDSEWADPNIQAHLIPKTTTDLGIIHQPINTQVTWLGHSTFLIQHNGINILTDPMFSDFASPVSFAGPKRYTDAALTIEQLPPIDIVVISHNHYDHLDEQSIRQLGSKPTYYLPSGMGTWFEDKGIEKGSFIELRWWQDDSIILQNSKVTVTATPSQHWSARGLGDKNEAHWASWLIELDGFTLWFAGDTGYNQRDFIDIGNYIDTLEKELDVALIPIGAYAPRDFMKAYHVNTEEAVRIHHDVRAKLSIGMHWGTFPLTAEKPMDPFHWLNNIRKETGFDNNSQFDTLAIGETRNIDHLTMPKTLP